MSDVFIVFFLLSLLCLPVALIKPSLFRFLQRGQPTRLKAGVTFIGLIVLFFILFAVTYPSPSNKEPSTKSSTDQQKKNTTSVKPTAEPTDPCAKYAGTDQMQSCVQMENALEKASEPNLNATVTYSIQGITIKNNDSIEWNSCDITIGADNNPNDFYELGGFNNTFPAYTPTTIAWGDITKSDGTRFDYASTQPRDLEIDCTVNGKAEKKIIN